MNHFYWETLLPMTLRACHTCKHAELILVPTTCKYGLSDQVLIIPLTKEPLWCAERVQSYTELSQYHCLSNPVGRTLVSTSEARTWTEGSESSVLVSCRGPDR